MGEPEVKVVEEPGVVLILFNRDVGKSDVQKFLRHLFADVQKRGHYLALKAWTGDWTGVLISVPVDWESWYVRLLTPTVNEQIQFVQRHHIIREGRVGRRLTGH